MTKVCSLPVLILTLVLLALSSFSHGAYRWQTTRVQLETLHKQLELYPEKFAGLYLDRSQEHVYIQVAGSQHLAFMSELLEGNNYKPSANASKDSLGIVLRVVNRSVSDLTTVQDEIRHDQTLINILDPVFVQWNIDVINNRLDIGVVEIDLPLQLALQKKYGDAVSLYQTQPSQTFSRQQALADGKVRGGAFTKTNIFCSTGFSVEHVLFEPFQGFLTAGHCLQSNFAVGGGSPSSSFLDINDVYMGTGIAWRFGDWSEQLNFEASWEEDTDAALVFDMLFSNQAVPKASVYTGGPNSNSKAYVLGQTTPIVNDQICFSGVKTGENCNVYITRTGVEKSSHVGFGFFANLRNLVEAQSWDGSIIAQKGDSGGPVYKKQSSLGTTFVTALGLIQGGPEDPAVVGQPSDIAYFAPIDDAIPQNWRLQIASCEFSWWTWSWQCTE